MRCHHCGIYGYIRPHYCKLYGYPQAHSQPKLKKIGKKVQESKVWKPKVTTTSIITHTSLRVSSREDMYFDSGCSKHMIGEMNYIEDLIPYLNIYVTSSDGEKVKSRAMKNWFIEVSLDLMMCCW